MITILCTVTQFCLLSNSKAVLLVERRVGVPPMQFATRQLSNDIRQFRTKLQVQLRRSTCCTAKGAPRPLNPTHHVSRTASVRDLPVTAHLKYVPVNCYRFNQHVLIDMAPMPEHIPKVTEIGSTSAPLVSAAFFIGARCRPYNDDYMKCKTDAYGRGELDCMKEGRKVTRCAASV